MERYTCLRELVPVIESALAAEGYVVTASPPAIVGKTRVTVMTRGNAVVSLHEDVEQELADIHVLADEHARQLTVWEQMARLGPPPLDRFRR